MEGGWRSIIGRRSWLGWEEKKCSDADKIYGHSTRRKPPMVYRRYGTKNAVSTMVFLASLQCREGGVTLIIRHDGSRMTIDPRIPAMPGRGTSGFHRPDGHCLHQMRSAEGCSASHMKGKLHPIILRTACETNIGTLCVISCIWMTTSNEGGGG